jgi:Fructosamine-3-kinase
VVLTDGKAHGIKLPYERIENALKVHEKYLEDVKTPSLVDYDLWEGNIFVKKSGEEYVIEGILDFERAFWGDPVADFPTSFLMADDIRKEGAFLETYLQASPNGRKYTDRDAVRYLLYRMYIFTIMAVEIYRYGFLYAQFQKSFAKRVVLKCLKELERA